MQEGGGRMEIKKWTAILLCIILCAGSIPIPCNAAAKKTSGTDGNGNNWVYNVNTKTLTFSGNKGIENYIFDGHSLEPGWYVWHDKAEHIIVNDGVTGIGQWAFYLFVELKTVVMADSVTRIGYGAFSACRNLKSIRLSANVTTIEREAFYRCAKLEHLTLPDTLKTLGTFGSCSKLKEVIIPDSVSRTYKALFVDCTSLSKIKLPKGMKEIKQHDFANCKNLRTLEIPEAVTTVSMSAFSGTKLKKIKLPKNVTTIKKGLSYRGKVFAVNYDFELPTKDLRLIEIWSKKVKSIAKGSFSGLSSKVVIKVPKSRKKKYTRMLRKSGLEKKVKIRTL